MISTLFILQIISSSTLFSQRAMEKLDRGLVAVKTSKGVFLSWRMFGTDPKDIAFNIYRDGTKVNSALITGATNMTDASGTTGVTYTVKAVIGDEEKAAGGTASVWDSQVQKIALKARPSISHQPNDINVGDLDGDGEYELVVKWYPDNAKDNSQSGITDNTYLAAYKLDGTFMWIIDLGRNIRSGAHYTQHLVGDYDSDGYAEVACKTAPGTKDGTGKYLSKGPAASDDDSKSYINGSGYVLSGPEYLTIFNGKTGEEMATVGYIVARGNVGSWGDTYGNRLDRYNSTNACLDGVHTSMVFQRGYYTRMAIAAWDWDGNTLKNRWTFDSNNAGSGDAAGDGNHNVMAADIDGDGFDEIIPGAACIDHDGKLKWNTKLGHGDANHIGDLDPDNQGLEVFIVHEGNKSEALVDAQTGKVLWRNAASDDNGRGLAADMDEKYRGHEMWSSNVSGVKTCQNKQISTSKPAINFRVYWDGDLLDEILNSNKIDKWNGGGTDRLLTLTGSSCNGSKSTPNLSADILGDWREEVILHDGSNLYIHTTTIPTEHKIYTLMHDPVYRNMVSSEQSAYNQPPHLSFWLGAGTDKIPIPDITVIGGQDCNGVVGGDAFYDQCGECVGGTTGKTACIVDCNGDKDGTASIDECGICSGGKTGLSPCVGAIQGENFCEATGAAESENAGYMGEGYVNFNNEAGASASWKLNAQSAIETKLSVIYSNGGEAARPLRVMVNGEEQATVSGAQTESWTEWVSEDITLKLASGTNTITFTSATADGGPNVDAIIINDEGVSAIGCEVKIKRLTAGWNLIGYPFDEATEVPVALKNIWAKVELVKNFNGVWDSSAEPAFNSLQRLEWSEGYFLKVSEDCELIWNR